VRHSTIVGTMNSTSFRSRLDALGLSVRSFAAMTGVQYETARHWGRARDGRPQAFPRWVPLILEMMDPSVSQYPPNEAVRRPLFTSNSAKRHFDRR
jgi:hypothetical protein